MTSTSLHHDTKAEPNLTPILDLVFQLITFFMLVINFKAASYDPGVKLPVVGSARPVDGGNQSEVLVLNIDASGSVNVYGEPHDADKYLLEEAEACVRMARSKEQQLEIGNELPTTVVIRADKATTFTNLNRALMACQKYGFHKVTLKVRDKEPHEQLR